VSRRESARPTGPCTEDRSSVPLNSPLTQRDGLRDPLSSIFFSLEQPAQATMILADTGFFGLFGESSG
ncbi:MAG: hypothetical protein LC808_12620, partial [Actinobacteria bacterium]|nr:hypothetical protein [Actinomycetota bacterium]